MKTNHRHKYPTTGHKPPVTNIQPPVTNHRSQISNHRSQTTAHKYPTTTHKYPTTAHKYPTTGHKPPLTNIQPPVTNHRSQISNHRSQISDHRSQTTAHKYPTTAHKYPTTGHKPPLTNIQPPVTNHRSQISNHRSQISNHRTQISNHWSQMSNHWSQTTGHKYPTTAHKYPTTGHKPPLTNIQPPVTNHRSQISNHRSQTISHKYPTTAHKYPCTVHKPPLTNIQPLVTNRWSQMSNQQSELDCLDICLIRDTRTGRQSRLPKDQRLRDLVSMGCQETSLEDKMLTIVHSTDTVNVSYTNFAANSREVAREWANELFRCATNLLALNRCPLSFLEKCYTKLCLVTNAEGMIPVKNIVRMFAQHRDDKKKIEKALEAAQLPTGKNDSLNPRKFKFRQFMSFYRHLCGRAEVDKIFYDLGSRKKPYLTAQQFVKFLNDEQRDPRLNEILYPYYDTEKAQTLIDHFELNPHMAIKGHLSQEGFLQYLLGEHNALITPEKLDLSEDMDQPLTHYFINSSHNTYLTGESWHRGVMAQVSHGTGESWHRGVMAQGSHGTGESCHMGVMSQVGSYFTGESYLTGGSCFTGESYFTGEYHLTGESCPMSQSYLAGESRPVSQSYLVGESRPVSQSYLVGESRPVSSPTLWESHAL
ncbi:hypothetical protein LSAT2_009974 [Lamellibrachia satsuma]|nr:hypothetical protein LSAT2_009974 [Lamellibrachia satsuma]